MIFWPELALLFLAIGIIIGEEGHQRREVKEIYYRLSKPTHHDQLPRGTQIIVRHGHHESVYEQTNHDDSHPCWHLQREICYQSSDSLNSDTTRESCDSTPWKKEE